MRRLIVLSSVLALSACAQTGPAQPGTAAASGPEACFRPQQVVNFRPGAQQNVYLRALGGDVFEVRSAGCLELERSNSLVITPAAGFTNRLCVGDSARLQVRGATIQQGPCQARIVRRLTEDEVAALPSRDRP